MTVVRVSNDPVQTGLASRFFARGLHWPLLVVGLLTIPVVAGGYLAYKATHDPTFAIESDYYRKAVAWDSTMAQEQANGTLGWHTSATAKSLGENVEISLRLQEKAGADVTNAKVKLVAFFLARSTDVQTSDAQRGADGLYHATLKLPHAGIHELRVHAERGTNVFTATHRLDIAR